MIMNSEPNIHNQFDSCCNTNSTANNYPEYFGNGYESNNLYENHFEQEELSQSPNGSNPLFNMSSNNNAMVYETVTKHTRIQIPSYVRGMELYDAKQQNACFYQDTQYSNCKYDQMLDYSMPNNQSYLGYNNLPYQHHMPVHNNMFLDYCGSPVQSSSSEEDGNTISEQPHAFISGEQPYTCPDTGAVCHVPQKRRGKQLWKYLYQLLQDDTNKKVICWSDNAKNQFEFKLLEPEEVATLWGKEKGKLNMNYDKLSRSLRFYYQKNLIQKVSGDHYVYRFPINPENLIKYIDTQTKPSKSGRILRTTLDSQRVQPYQMSPYTRQYTPGYCYEQQQQQQQQQQQPPPIPSQYYDMMPLPLSQANAQAMQITYPSS